MKSTELGAVDGQDSVDSSPSTAEWYRRQLEAVTDNATLALFIMDEHQQCTYMNPAAERLTGFRLAEVRGKPLHEYVHHTRPDGRPYPLEECPIDQAFPQNMREQGEEVFVHPDGRFYPVAFTASPILENGKPVGTIIEVRDITEEKRAEAERERLVRELKLERTRLATVFHQAPAMIVVLRGPEHVFELANEPYLQLIGRNDVLGKPVRYAMPELVEQGFIDVLDRVYRSGEPFFGNEFPVRIRRQPETEPEERYFDFVYQPLIEADGDVSGLLGLGIDVTERVRGRTEIEEANRAKGDFLAAMSHELRTPLNAIGGYVDLLDRGIYGALNEEQRQALSRVTASQRHLLRLINDVLAFARLEAGELEFDLRPLAAAEVLLDAERLVAALARAKSIDLGVDECDAGLRVQGDAERVRQILLNLVGNAIKFTTEGGRIRLAAAREQDCVMLCVSDNGIGIAPEKQERIFDPFVQADRKLNRPQEGIGLGLAISRDLARAMGGDLRVESTLGEGSTFVLRLPAAP